MSLHNNVLQLCHNFAEPVLTFCIDSQKSELPSAQVVGRVIDSASLLFKLSDDQA